MLVLHATDALNNAMGPLLSNIWTIFYAVSDQISL